MGVSDGSIIIVGAGIFGLTAAIEPAEPSLPPASPGGSPPLISHHRRETQWMTVG
jgi:succinate dehydrogenase/fumarate reductase flavoprotein subunit